MSHNIHAAALDYLDRGISIIPVNGKIPAIRWAKYQRELASPEEVSQWFDGSKNLGIVTGDLSGLAVVDFDTDEAWEEAQRRGLPKGPLVKTGRGYHLYCQYQEGLRNFQKRDDLPGIDLRAEGGYAVAPPAVHENGHCYEWLVSLDEYPLQPVPGWVVADKPEQKQPVKTLYSGTDSGGRNNALARLVGSWVNDGGSVAEITEQARVWNQTNRPPLDDGELVRTVTSIHEAHSRKTEALPDLITDTRVAEHFSQNFKHKVRYWAEPRKWLIYDGQRWNTDTPGGPYPALKEELTQLYEAARTITDDNRRQAALKGIVTLESHSRQETLLKAASVVPEMIVTSSQLDRDPMLLNCRNGTLNLKTGELRPHKSEDFITKLVNIDYSPDADCPTFKRFLEQVLGNENLTDYLQRFMGYTLTGRTTEQVLLFMYGTGANGKSTLASLMELVLGDLAATAGSDLLMQRDRRSATNDLAGLRGSRLVKVSEFDDGERLAEATVKTLTGGDRVACRFLYGEYFEYTPAFKVLLLGNYKPKIRGRDHGIWRRIHLLPFNVTIPEQDRDPDLMDKLRDELPGILAWTVKGCLAWQEKGLSPPAEVLKEVKEYRESEDIFSQWLDECCEVGDYQTPARDLMDSFIQFSNWRRISATKFGRMLADAGFQKIKDGSIYWRGLAISGQFGQLDSFSVNPREKKSLEDFTKKGLNCPNYPKRQLQVEDFLNVG